MSRQLHAFLLVAAAAAALLGNVDAGGKTRGFRVSGTRILDGRGRPFVMRGINLPYNWFRGGAAAAIPAIARTGANVVRIVLADGDKWARDDATAVGSLLGLCKRNRLVAIVEVHDATGSDDQKRLDDAVKYWVSIAGVLKGREDHVIINVANEWMKSMGKAEHWAAGYRAALPALRRAGLNHLLVVDAAGYGQDAAVIPQRGRSVFQADPQRNVIFSIHMYTVAGANAATVQRNIDQALAIGVPVIVGEFADSQSGQPVDATAIMSHCKLKGVGWLAWSWYGNSDARLDMAHGPAGQLTQFGKKIIEGPNGIRKTAKAANI